MWTRVKIAARWPLQWVGLATAQSRVLPTFLIIGAQRSGTSSLYKALSRHPLVVPSLVKEVHFFDLYFGKGLSWYRAHFPTSRYIARLSAHHGRPPVTGESSPYYLFHPLAPKRAASVLPNGRFIVLLRNPVDRAYSHWQHEVRAGLEPLSFVEAIGREEDRLFGEVGRMLGDASYVSFNHRHYSYLSRGYYVQQLRVWMDCFGRERFLVIRSEDLFISPARFFAIVLEFLGLPPWTPVSYPHRNQQAYPMMDGQLRHRLNVIFQPHNHELSTFLGWKTTWE